MVWPKCTGDQKCLFLAFVERNTYLLAERFLFYIDDENNGAISETREYFVLGQFGFLRERVCDFVIMFTVNVVNSFQSMF